MSELTFNFKSKKMKKKILILMGIFVFGIMTIMNASMAKNGDDTVLDLLSLGKIASAELESGDNCPGGSCSYTDSFGDSCNACCPEGKDPLCDSTGCRCW